MGQLGASVIPLSVPLAHMEVRLGPSNLVGVNYRRLDRSQLALSAGLPGTVSLRG